MMFSAHRPLMVRMKTLGFPCPAPGKLSQRTQRGSVCYRNSRVGLYESTISIEESLFDWSARAREQSPCMSTHRCHLRGRQIGVARRVVDVRDELI